MEKISWILLEQEYQIQELVQRSNSTPCLIFKHSSKCFVSSVALKRLEDHWSIPKTKLIPYFLDVIKNRNMAKYVSEVFIENHETPQILLIEKGECILEATEMDIKESEIREMLG